MLLSDEYVFHALEMRMKTRPVIGTLCKVPDTKHLHNAMKYFDTWNYGNYISQPYVKITPELARSVTFNVFRIFIDLNDLYHPPFTADEILVIIDLCKKFGYTLTHNKGYISIKREVMNEDIRTRH